ncbi:MAG: YigZ family protein [Spirochaetia bacterium]|jgi:uncharacterized YigZ family protein|nr:YigZ family protein [Spirochaetia bacterium]
MKVPIDTARANLEIKKSKFIAIAYPCTTLQEVKQLVTETKAAYPDATHVVHAAIVGPTGTSFSFSDDHEPKNTAGRPAFEVLRGSGITDIAVMIIRYFGGTLLGTGGLVRAYGDSMKAVLEKTKTEELVLKKNFSLQTSYDLFEPIKALLEQAGCTIAEETFTTTVDFSGSIPETACMELVRQVSELSKGKDTIIFSSV